MNIKSLINLLLEKVGFQLVSVSRVGIQVFNDIRKTGIKIDTVFDVGANVGQTSLNYLKRFPEAEIHAFEPVLDNFKILEKIRSQKLVSNRLAMGAEKGQMRIFLSKNIGKHSAVVRETEDAFEDVDCQTLTEYCLENKISHIGLLKIDTEGSDLDVLKGADSLLSNQQIDFVFVETGFYPKQRHVHICMFIDYLFRFGYSVAGIYDQSWEWNGKAQIQYANILFVKPGIVTEK